MTFHTFTFVSFKPFFFISSTSDDGDDGAEAGGTSISGETKISHFELCQRLLMVFLAADQKIWTLKHCAEVIYEKVIEKG